MKKLNKLLTVSFIILSLLLVMDNSAVHAQESFPLTINHCGSGMSLHLYKVADGKFGSYKYTEAFQEAKYANIDINKLENANETQIAATTLKGYAVNKDHDHRIADGNVVKYEHLSTGLYLLVVDNYREGRKLWKYSPILIDMKESKTISLTKRVDDEYYDYKLLKQWNGTSEPPQRITVDLYVDGKIERTVILEKEKNYTYSWETDGYKDYSVAEHHIDGYKNTVSIVQNDGLETIVLTNTKNQKQPPAVRTGDSTHYTIYVFYLALSGLALILIGKRLEK
ncbi:MAG: Cna B-type domain-containing protein [Sharpea porci]